ncbi:hypothetical protein BDIM_15990 [Brevundimonas diminuta ATCC 11568]|nr:hypothetical protein BDIM_15990 [Brevundimonas diminuta ATCC 11568]
MFDHFLREFMTAIMAATKLCDLHDHPFPEPIPALLTWRQRLMERRS